MQIIIGKNTVLETLKHRPSNIIKIFIEKEKKYSIPKNFSVEIVSKQKLLDLAKTKSHQGIVAQIKDRHYGDLEVLLKKDGKILLLDSIYDPQNLGAILRSAECFKIDGIIFSKNRGCSITPVVTKAAAGATELINLFKVSNLVETIKKLKTNGYVVIALDNSPKAINMWNIKLPPKYILIAGSEGRGIQPLLKKNVDITVKIPLLGKIDHLNVSQAVSIFLAYASRKLD